MFFFFLVNSQNDLQKLNTKLEVKIIHQHSSDFDKDFEMA